MSKILLLLLFCFSVNIVNAESEWLLSNSAKVSFINCNQGNRPYSVFGHSALRFTDSLNKFDIVFNYGAFNSDETDFYINFLRGNLTFYLVIERMQDFVAGYIEEGRAVTEIPLTLSQNDKQQVFNFLMWNAEAENAAYEYNFLNNNCATRLRDVLKTKTTHPFLLDYDNIAATKTFRALLNEHINNMPWIQLTFYLLLGIKADAVATAKESVFLPKYLRTAMLTAHDGKNIIAADETIILKENLKAIHGNLFTHPVLIVSAALLLLFSIYFSNNKKLIGLSIAIAFIFTGIIGCLLCYLWLFTLHSLTVNNLNLLWAFPFNVVFGFALIFTHNKFVLRCTKYYGVWLILIGLFAFFSPQEFYPALKFWLPTTGLFLIFSSAKLISPK